MMRFTKALMLGIAAGIIDIAPMVIMHLSPWSIASAFTHWVILAVIIAYLRWDIRPWLKGLVVALASAIPVVLMVAPVDVTAPIPVVTMSAVLGASVGYFCEKWAK